MNTRLATTGSKGFITLYVLYLLAICCSVSLAVNQYVTKRVEFISSLDDFHIINNAEILAIQRIKQKFDEYDCKDERIEYNGCLIEIRYKDEKALLDITYRNFRRNRILEYDSIEGIVIKYY